MDIKERSSTSDQIIQNMKDQGRSMTWLIEQLNVSRRTFYLRLNDNTWKIEDIIKMQQIGVL